MKVQADKISKSSNLSAEEKCPIKIRADKITKLTN